MGKKLKKRKDSKKGKCKSIPVKEIEVIEIKKIIDPDTDMDISDDVNDQYDRIFKILNVMEEEDAEVTYENLDTYLEYLKKEITLPVRVTGVEDMGCFRWEEYYGWGPGSKKEYEKLRKTNPSYQDEYEILSFNEELDENAGIYVNVKRLSDKRKFVLTLADLETVEKKSKNDCLLDDYSVWYANFR